MEKFNSSMENIAAGSGNREGCRILLAEDDEINQKVARLILQKTGFQVDIVANGQQAVAAFKQSRYDLILMDVQMPVMDGHEATREIREWELKADDRGQKTENRFQNTGQQGRMIEAESEIRNWEGGMRNKSEENSDSNSDFPIPTSDFKKVPIIAMTGDASMTGFDPQRYPGMDDWVCKPLRRDHLLPVINRWTGLHSGEAHDQSPVKPVDAPIDKADGKNLPIDLDRAIDEFMGKKKILYAVLDQFISRTGEEIAGLRRALGRSDCRLIAADAHRLKGAAANLRADRLSRVAADLEKAAENEKTEEICNLIEKLAEEFHQLENFFRQID